MFVSYQPERTAVSSFTSIVEKLQVGTSPLLAILALSRENRSGSLNEFFAKHRKPAFGGLARCFVLDHIPVLGKNATLYSNNVRHDAVSGLSYAGISPMHDHEIVLGNNFPGLIPKGRRNAFDEVEEAIPTGRDMGTVLNVAGRPKFLGRRVVALIEKCFECFKDKFLVFDVLVWFIVFSSGAMSMTARKSARAPRVTLGTLLYQLTRLPLSWKISVLVLIETAAIWRFCWAYVPEGSDDVYFSLGRLNAFGIGAFALRHRPGEVPTISRKLRLKAG
jgi:hypothetical protein